MNIVLIGIQGCGKGTLVAGLSKHYDFDLISVGQLLRDEVATGSKLGQEIDKLQKQGKFVELSIVMSAVGKALENSSKNIKIFDGFPRNSIQADKLDEIAKVDLVLHLELSKDIAINRILNRLTCEKCGYVTTKSESISKKCNKCGGNLVTRSDDTIEAVNKRFEQYEKETYPLLNRYRAQGVVVDINANRTSNEVLEDVLKVIDNEYKN